MINPNPRRSDIELARLFETISQWETIGTDTQYKIIEEAQETILIFCPSNSKKDWRINLSFPKIPYRKMEIPFLVHGGFLKEWVLIRDHFLEYFENKLEAGEGLKPITVTGWSYGGAMATLAVEGLLHDLPILQGMIRLVTFGSPRVVGFLNFSKVRGRWADSTLYRNDSDLVTFVPLVLLGFRHVKKKTRIGRRFSLWDLPRVKRSHNITGYIESLEVISA